MNDVCIYFWTRNKQMICVFQLSEHYHPSVALFAKTILEVSLYQSLALNFDFFVSCLLPFKKKTHHKASLNSAGN